jgi:shikimate kinase
MKGTPAARPDRPLPVDRPQPPVRAIFLVGFMGAGKTTVGRALSEFMGWRFEDLDDRIRAREGRSIPEIFARSGEAAFRRSELAALQDLLQEVRYGPPTVAALGGGAFAQQEVLNLLEESGNITIFLDASIDELWQRCSADGVERPLLRHRSEFEQLYQKRRPYYLRARVRVETGSRAIQNIVEEITGALPRA